MPYVKVDPDDIALANRLAHEILGHSLDELSRPGNDLLMQLEELATERMKRSLKENPDSKTKVGDLSFSRRDIREFTGWSNTRLHVHLKELVDFEYIVIETGRNGMPFRYRLAWEGQGKDGKRFMLGLKDVTRNSARRREPFRHLSGGFHPPFRNLSGRGNRGEATEREALEAGAFRKRPEA